MPDYDELRADALALLQTVSAEARRGRAEETLRRLAGARERLAGSTLSVVVCGEFDRGKSTLLNAFLDQDPGLFPAGVLHTTSVVTSVGYGETERITISLAPRGDGPGESRARTEERTLGSRRELEHYVTQDGNPGTGQRVAGVSIELPSPRLASGLVLVDTPGIGGLHAGHAVETNRVLPLADAIVFVANAHQPLTRSEIQFLRRAIEYAGIADDPHAVICVLTKTDLETSHAEIVADTQAKLADATGWPGIPVVPVSSQAKLDYLASGDEDDLADSNFPEFERVLWDVVTRRRARSVLGSALEEIDRSVAALLKPVEAELDALRASGPRTAEEVRGAYEDRSRRLGDLTADAATWRGDFTRDAERMAAEVRETVLGLADRAWKNVPGYVEDDLLIEDVDRLLQRVSEDLAPVTWAADRILYERSARLLRELAARLSLHAGSTEISRLPPAPVPIVRGTTGTPPPETRDESGGAGGRDKASTARSFLAIGSTVGSVLGRVIEVFVAPGAGALIGGAIGAGIGLLAGGAAMLGRWAAADGAARRLPVKRRRAELRTDLDTYYRQVLRPHLTDHVTATARTWAGAVIAETDSRIRQEQASYAEAVSRAREPEPADPARAAAREKELDAIARDLRTAERRARELASEAGKLAAGGEA